MVEMKGIKKARNLQLRESGNLIEESQYFTKTYQKTVLKIGGRRKVASQSRISYPSHEVWLQLLYMFSLYYMHCSVSLLSISTNILYSSIDNPIIVSRKILKS